VFFFQIAETTLKLEDFTLAACTEDLLQQTMRWRLICQADSIAKGEKKGDSQHTTETGRHFSKSI